MNVELALLVGAWEYFAGIEPQLFRYPALDPDFVPFRHQSINTLTS